MNRRTSMSVLPFVIALSICLVACNGGAPEETPSENQPPVEQQDSEQQTEKRSPVTTEEFMSALATGLTNRYALGELNPSLDDTDPKREIGEMHARIECEWVALAPFEGAEFEDSSLEFLAGRYIASVKQQEELSRSTDISLFRFRTEWNSYGEKRPELLRRFVNDYGLRLDDEYQPFLETAMKQDRKGEHIDEFTIVNVNRGADDESGYWEMEVTVRNNTDETKTFLGFQVIELDADGNIIDSYMSYNKNYMPVPVEPGQELTISLTEHSGDGMVGFKSTMYVWSNENGVEVEGTFSEPYTTTF